MLLLDLASIAAPAFGEDSKPTVEVRAEYLMTVEVLYGPRAPVGQRIVLNITGGSVHGPNIKGEIMPTGAADWLIIMPDGSSRVDARYTIKTDDGAFILMETGGIVAFSKEALDRLRRGEVISASESPGYFIVTPRFMTESPKYLWLNHIQGVGNLVSLQPGVRLKYDVFAMR